MAVGPRAVLRCTLREGASGRRCSHSIGERLRVDANHRVPTKGLEHLFGVLKFRLRRVGLHWRVREFTEKLRRFIEERDIGVSEWGVRRARKQTTLVAGQSRRAVVEKVWLAEQITDEHVRTEREPAQVDRDAQLAVIAQVARDFFAVIVVDVLAEVRDDLTSETVDHLFGKGGPCLVVRFAVASGPRLRVFNVGARQHHRAAVDAELLVAPRHALTFANGRANHVSHLGPALDHRDVVTFAVRNPHTAHESSKSGRHRTCFAKRRKDMVDVPQERRRRSHQQDTAPLQHFAVVVEQIRGAVESDSSLAGARTALDNECAVERSANDRILLRLDRGDDIAHASRTAGIERREQCPFACEVCFLPCFAKRLDIKDVVLDGDDAPALGGEVAPAHYSGGVGSRGGIERRRGWGAPVGQQWRKVGIREADAAHVKAFAVCHVEAPKAQAVFDCVELSDAILVQRGEGIAFGSVLRRSGRALLAHLGEPFHCFVAKVVEPAIEAINDALFSVDSGICADRGLVVHERPFTSPAPDAGSRQSSHDSRALREPQLVRGARYRPACAVIRARVGAWP